jgi:hypothetical protein
MTRRAPDERTDAIRDQPGPDDHAAKVLEEIAYA